MFSFEILKNEYEKILGYPLFKDYGELTESYRATNTIVHPVCGIFRMQDSSVTAVPSPFLGVFTAEIEMVVVPDLLEEVERKMNDAAVYANGTSLFVEDGGRTYSVTYQCQTARVGEKTDLPWYHGAVFILRQAIAYTIIEGGLPSSGVRLYIDGHLVPTLSLAKTRAHTTSVLPNAQGRGQAVTEMTALGFDFNIPVLLGDDLANIFARHIDADRSNRALCVELEEGTRRNSYIMGIVSISENVAPPQVVGMGISLAEIPETAAIFNGLWSETEVTGIYANAPIPPTDAGVVVFWGDGTSDRTPKNPHIYTDGEPTHTVRVFDLSDGIVAPSVGDQLEGVTLIVTEKTSAFPFSSGTDLLTFSSGDGITVQAGHFCMRISDGGSMLYLPLDHSLDDWHGLDAGDEIRVPITGTVTKYTGELPLAYRLRDREVF